MKTELKIQNIGFFSILADVLGTLLVLTFTDVVGEPSMEVSWIRIVDESNSSLDTN